MDTIVERSLVTDLAGRISGSVLTPRDAGYEAACAVHNGLVDRRPALIVRCRTTTPELLRFYGDAVTEASDDLTVFAGLVHEPDGSGAKLAALVLFHSGDAIEAERDLEPFTKWGSPLVVQVGPMPYPVMNTILDGGFPAGLLHYWLSSFTRGLPDELIDIAVERFAIAPSAMTSILLEHFHGAVTRVGMTTSATTRQRTPSAPPTGRTTSSSARSSGATTRRTSSTSTTTSRPSASTRRSTHHERNTMKNVIRRNRSRAEGLAASAVALVAIAGAAGIVAAQANAAPHVKAKLAHGVLRINGTDASDRVALRLKAGEPGVLQVDVGDDGSAEARFERAQIARIAVNGGDGGDLVRIDESNGAVNAGIPTTLRGGDGDDTLGGGSGDETLRGGDGSDSIDGNRGADVGLMGDGDDTFVWDPGDGSDVVEGQDGHDTMVFNGAPGAEQFDLSANGHRLRFFRTQGAITMDTAGVEQVDVAALGGADTVTVNDLTGTDVGAVNADLAGALGGATGDAQPDRVIVNGTDGNDTIDVSGDAGGVKVSGLTATIGILHSEAASDRLEVNTLAGTDSVDSAGLAAGAIQLFVDGALVP